MHFATNEEHWAIYGSRFVRDMRWDKAAEIPICVYPEDYQGQEAIMLAPSQHEGVLMTAAEQKKVTARWASFLAAQKLPLREVQTVTSLVQKVFDALCCQDSIESLRIKWLNCKDLSQIGKLKNLKKLFIEVGSRIEDISPLTEMEHLEVLILGSTVKVTDYSLLKNLKDLRVFSVLEGRNYPDSRLKIDSIDFLYEMPCLEYVDLVDVKTPAKHC